MRRRSCLARSLLLLVFWSAFAAGAPALADDDEHDGHHDHDEVRRIVERGEALPLDAVLAAVAKEIKGEVVGVEFDKEDGTWVYELRIIDPSGRMLEVLADARTAAIIEVEGE
ncbi:MAG: PepSY domain-containing protein [Dongiaceae bacterium]